MKPFWHAASHLSHIFEPVSSGEKNKNEAHNVQNIGGRGGGRGGEGGGRRGVVGCLLQKHLTWRGEGAEQEFREFSSTLQMTYKRMPRGIRRKNTRECRS